MKLIIGLGNPGKKYKYTRHNAGFIILDELKNKYSLPDFTFEKKFKAEISKGIINNIETVLAKPQTFMNNSGEAVRLIIDFYKLKPEDLIIIHDDVDIEFGKVKPTDNSGAAGHNGVQSIIDAIGTQKFQRFRIGTLGDEKRKELRIPIDDFVLQNFSNDELNQIKDLANSIL
jgi:peptidyl-tRNA hydrolase, PTH1 family